MVRSVAVLLPLQDTVLSMELQEDGSFYIDMAAPFAWIDDTAFKSGENFLTEYLSERITGGKIVGKTEGHFKGYDEEWTEIYSLLKQKDFDGLIALVNGNPGKYLDNIYSDQAPYRTPEELTVEQRAFYDSYVERIEVYMSEVTYAKTQEHYFRAVVVAPALDAYDQEAMEWYTENGIEVCEHVYHFGSDRKEKLIEVMSRLLSLVEDGIEYAEMVY